MTAKPIQVADLAERLGRDWEGDGDLWIDVVAPLAEAGPTHLSFVRSKKWSGGIRSSRAGTLIVPLALEARKDAWKTVLGSELVDKLRSDEGANLARYEEPYAELGAAWRDDG